MCPFYSEIKVSLIAEPQASAKSKMNIKRATAELSCHLRTKIGQKEKLGFFVWFRLQS